MSLNIFFYFSTLCICAGLYPQISKIVRPAQRFTDTQGGKIEKNVQAQELEFFIYDNSKEVDRLLGDTVFDIKGELNLCQMRVDASLSII